MDASDLIKPLQNTLQGGGRPHMENRRPARRLFEDAIPWIVKIGVAFVYENV
jgi:hypothetical protein